MPWALALTLLLAWPVGGADTPTPAREASLLVLRPELPPVEVAVISLEGWPYLDLLDLALEAGWTVHWDPGGLSVLVPLPEEPARLLVGSDRILVGDRLVPLSRPARILDGRPLVPLDFCRFMDRELGTAAGFDAKRRHLVIRPGPPVRPAGLERPTGSGRPVILLDPGHGGEDPGQIGAGGASEARAAWALCREVHLELRRRGGPPSILTHGAEEGVDDLERCRIVHRRGADLVLCVHVAPPTGGGPVLRIITTTPGEPAGDPGDGLPVAGSVKPAQAEVAAAWADGLAEELARALPALEVRTARLPLRAARLYQRPTVLLELPAFGPEGALPMEPEAWSRLVLAVAEGLTDWETVP